MKREKRERVNVEIKDNKVKMQFISKDNKDKIKYEYDANERNWMIVKATYNGVQMLTLARDVDGTGKMYNDEVRMDDNYYTEETGDARIQELSKETGIKAMDSEDFVKLVNGMLGSK